MATEKVVEIIVPSSPADREDIFKVIKDLSDSLTRTESESEYRKDALKALSEKYGIERKYFGRLLTEYHKDLHEKKSDEQQQFEDLYDAIVK